jgi:hypothetical protein
MLLNNQQPTTNNHSYYIAVKRFSLSWAVVGTMQLVIYETMGTADGGTVVKVLHYKSEGRWFVSR